jgi:tetratricopeptide (TPR) repeat protein
VQAAAHPTQAEAEEIADALLTAVQLDEEDPEVEVEVETQTEAGPEEAPPEEDRSADEIGSDLLAAMDAAVAAEDGGIELDMDALLEKNKAQQAAETEAQSPRRNKQTAALAQVQSTGNAEAQGHQFVDPFDALKQKRKARAKGRSSSKRARAKAGGKHEKSKPGSKLLLAGALLATLGYLGFDYIASRPPPPDPGMVAAAEIKAQSAREEKRAASARQKMQAKLNAELSAVQEDEIEAFRVVDEQLIPVGGPPPGAPVRSGSISRLGIQPARVAVGSVGQVDQRETTSADHVAMGKAAAAQGKWSLAAMAYNKALQMDPANANLRAQRGQALYRAGRKDDAEAELRQAAASGAVSAYKLLGRLAEDQGDTAGAVAHYQSYLRSGPRDRAGIEKRIQALTNGPVAGHPPKEQK